MFTDFSTKLLSSAATVTVCRTVSSCNKHGNLRISVPNTLTTKSTPRHLCYVLLMFYSFSLIHTTDRKQKFTEPRQRKTPRHKQLFELKMSTLTYIQVYKTARSRSLPLASSLFEFWFPTSSEIITKSVKVEYYYTA